MDSKCLNPQGPFLPWLSDTNNHRNLGYSLIVIGVVLGAFGSYFLPTTATTQCDNGNCLTTKPELVNYVVAWASGAGTGRCPGLSGLATEAHGDISFIMLVRPDMVTHPPVSL